MIRHRITKRELLDAIDHERPGWRDRADSRIDELEALATWADRGRIWTDIKGVYMRLQGHTCGFCQRRLEWSAWGNVEHDVEHYRPKARADGWPTPQMRDEWGIEVRSDDGRTDVTDRLAADDADPGYYLLAYNPENYLVACKTCNTALKRNWFPVSRDRITGQRDVRDLRAERPYLPYPIGSSDRHDPEELITFVGIAPVAAASRGFKKRRGEVTIRFFQLDTREGLLLERAEVLLALHLAMLLVDDPDPLVAAVADRAVERLVDPRSAHSSCARAHHDRLLNDPAMARAIIGRVVEWLDTLHWPTPGPV